jgi:hypothetical protein
MIAQLVKNSTLEHAIVDSSKAAPWNPGRMAENKTLKYFLLKK